MNCPDTTSLSTVQNCSDGGRPVAWNGATTTLATGSEILLAGTGPPDRKPVGLMSRAPVDAKAPMDKPYFKQRANPRLAQSGATTPGYTVVVPVYFGTLANLPQASAPLQSVAHQLHREHTCLLHLHLHFQVAACRSRLANAIYRTDLALFLGASVSGRYGCGGVVVNKRGE